MSCPGESTGKYAPNIFLFKGTDLGLTWMFCSKQIHKQKGLNCCRKFSKKAVKLKHSMLNHIKRHTYPSLSPLPPPPEMMKNQLYSAIWSKSVVPSATLPQLRWSSWRNWKSPSWIPLRQWWFDSECWLGGVGRLNEDCQNAKSSTPISYLHFCLV